jgi:flagellar biogenesis protein FliO
MKQATRSRNQNAAAQKTLKIILPLITAVIIILFLVIGVVELESFLPY